MGIRKTQRKREKEKEIACARRNERKRAEEKERLGEGDTEHGRESMNSPVLVTIIRQQGGQPWG